MFDWIWQLFGKDNNTEKRIGLMLTYEHT